MLKSLSLSKMMLVSLFTLLYFCSIAQPANDDPCGAIELTLENGPGCVPVTPFVWQNATATPGVPQPSCASFSTGDIWFKFTLSDAADVFITTIEGSGGTAITDGAMELYNNDLNCDGTMHAYLCDDDAGEGSMPRITIPAMVPGTYYIRFWDFNDATSGNIGGICVSANPVLTNTINDDPCTATVLEVQGTEICVPSEPVSWDHATATSGIDYPSCGSYKSGDIWFTFTLTDTSDIFIKTTEGTGPSAILNGAMSLYLADDCTGLMIEQPCQDNQGNIAMPEIAEASKLPGQYYIRFWDTKDSLSGNIGGICIAAHESIVIPLLNDDPCGAIELTVVNDISCLPDNPLAWSNATGSDVPNDNVCGSYETGDIWYKFTLAEKSDIFITTLPGVGAGAITDGAMSLYAASACDGQFTFAFCEDGGGVGYMPQLEERAIPAGTYYIRFWDYDDKVSGNFGGICVAAVPSSSLAPNDQCFTAIAFPDLPLDGSCASVLVNTAGATGDSVNICGGIADDDVWYTFVVPDGITQVSYEITENGVPKSEVIRLLRGDCLDGLFLSCHADSIGVFANLISGQLYTIRTQTIEGGVAGLYEICLTALLPPDNDEPCGAISLTTVQGNTCDIPITYAWENATPSEDQQNPPCGNFSDQGDVWFKFEITEASDIIIRTIEGAGPDGITDGAMTVYRESGDCNSLTYLGCLDDVDTDHLMPEFIDFNLETGTYYIRFWEYYGVISGNIGICVAITPTISTADNDQCSGATPFPVIPTDGTCAMVEVNSEGATGSPNISLPAHNDDDLWYTFVVPDGISMLYYEVSTIMGNSQHYICVSSSCDFIGDCTTGESGLIEGLISGETYYIRAYTAEEHVYSIYNICLRTPPPPPSNDECEGAIAFPEIPADGSCSIVHVDTKWSTISGFSACQGDENDVWYSFTMPEDVSDLLINIYTTSKVAIEGYEIFSGTCGNLESVFCMSDIFFDVSQVKGLNPGETYYLRTFTQDFRVDSFTICIHAPKSPPANDECPNAIAFPELPLDGTCATVIADVTGATGDFSDACAFLYDDDVWYTFSIPDGYSGVIINTTPMPVSGSIGIYSGTCDDLTLVGCHSYFESVITGLTPGETYYARAHSAFLNVEGSFEICMRLADPPPANDSCVHAIAFPEIPVNGDWVSQEGTTLSATGDDLEACNGIANDDVWFSFVVPDGVHDIIYNTEYWDPYVIIELYEGTCEEPIFIDCYSAGNTDGAFVGLNEGQTYYMRVYNADEYFFSVFNLRLKVPLPLTNDDCITATAFPALPLDGSCVYVHGTNVGAESVSDLDFCGELAGYPDIWYTFTMPEGGYTSVSMEVLFESGNGISAQLFEGTCDQLESVECMINPTVDDFSGLTPGQTYWIRVLPSGHADFNLCLRLNPLPPANDDCENATSLTSSPGVFTDPGPQSTDGATNSHLEACYPLSQNVGFTYDVWYSFVTDEDGGDATINVTYAYPYFYDYAFFNFIIQGFEGECGDFTTLSCFDWTAESHTAEDTMIDIRLYGLNPLTTYYFRLYPTALTTNYAPIDFTVLLEGSALDPITAVEEPEAKNFNRLDIAKVYPSPASSAFYVDFNNPEMSDVTLYVTDVFDRQVYHRRQTAKEGENHFAVTSSGLPSGIYFVTLERNGIQSESKRVVIQ